MWWNPEETSGDNGPAHSKHQPSDKWEGKPRSPKSVEQPHERGTSTAGENDSC